MTRASLLSCAFLLALTATAQAFDSTGHVVNGTTGDRNPSVDVIIVNPSAGMLQERTISTEDGTFSATGLSADAPIYMVRVDYKGITYNEPVRPSEGDADVVLMIYEPMESWDEVMVSVPHIVAQRHSGHLEVEQLYEINNVSNPPRSVAGDDAAFRFRVPKDKHEITGVYVTALGMPVQRAAEPTDDPEIFQVTYPIRPGVTRIGVSYSLPYQNDTYTLSGALLYDITQLIVYGVDPDMEISTTGVEFTSNESAHGMTAYVAAHLDKGTEVAITFTGGSGRSSIPSDGGDTAHGGGGTVMVVSNATEEMSLVMMVIILLALTAFMGITIHGGESPLDRPSNLRAHYEVLLKRLAKLDDLRKAELVSDEVHRAQREELRGQLAALMYRLRTIEPGAHNLYVGPPPKSPNSPGEEQRSAS